MQVVNIFCELLLQQRHDEAPPFMSDYLSDWFMLFPPKEVGLLLLFLSSGAQRWKLSLVTTQMTPVSSLTDPSDVLELVLLLLSVGVISAPLLQGRCSCSEAAESSSPLAAQRKAARVALWLKDSEHTPLRPLETRRGLPRTERLTRVTFHNLSLDIQIHSSCYECSKCFRSVSTVFIYCDNNLMFFLNQLKLVATDLQPDEQLDDEQWTPDCPSSPQTSFTFRLNHISGHTSVWNLLRHVRDWDSSFSNTESSPGSGVCWGSDNELWSSFGRRHMSLSAGHLQQQTQSCQDDQLHHGHKTIPVPQTQPEPGRVRSEEHQVEPEVWSYLTQETGPCSPTSGPHRIYWRWRWAWTENRDRQLPAGGAVIQTGPQSRIGSYLTPQRADNWARGTSQK